MAVTLFTGDCLEVMRGMEDDSVDSAVIDPPYGISFMQSKWDYDVPSVEVWREVYRVLKPGGHLLSFAGARTYHRVAVNIEDAGFEIRDQIMWLYGSGFPKSHSVSKSIEKAAGVEGEIIGDFPNDRPNSHGKNGIPVGSAGLGKGKKMRALVTPEAQQWEGWGTALKPAHEPIVVARKPLEGTVAANVLEYGVGALNIDGTRISHNEKDIMRKTMDSPLGMFTHPNSEGERGAGPDPQGRWPANIILDEEAGEILDEQAPTTGNSHWPDTKVSGFGEFGHGSVEYEGVGPQTTGKGASRFFYCVKANKKEREAGLDELEMKLFGQSGGAQGALNRDEETYIQEDTFGLNSIKERKNDHPTVKPIDLMRYLCRLVTPPGGVVLDCFMGSGTTGIAACLEDFDFIGIEMEEDYMEIARHRIAHWGDYEIDEGVFKEKKEREWL